ncbi:pimeloyl-ACP methyl ester esterase BioH, partial [Salmonella enterica subsp. enterica serovar Infantis]
MIDIWWQTYGEGICHLVVLDVWGLNAVVWHCFSEELGSHFCLHLVDL